MNRPPSSRRARSAVWILTAGALLTSALSASPATAENVTAPVVNAGSLWDEARLLGHHERAAIERSLRTAATKCGNPVSIVIVPQLAAHETIEELARRTFTERGLDAPGPPQVLLAVSKRERRAAVETGQGPAGIVPEIDARQITRHLSTGLRAGRLTSQLADAITRIVVSAQATAERRRPSPPDPLDEPPAADSPGSVDAMENVPPPTAAAAAAVTVDPVAPPPAAPSHTLSLYQSAAMLSALVVLGLALRRRRKIALEQSTKPDLPRPRPGR